MIGPDSSIWGELGLNDAHRAKLQIYDDLLLKWQRSINLVSASTLDDRWRRHFLDSAQLHPLLKQHCQSDGSSLLDIGSGAGFPGLVLGCCGWGNIVSVEAVAKKAHFQRQLIAATEIDATVLQQRIEDSRVDYVDIIVARACASVAQLFEWGQPFCHSTTEFWLLKGQHVDDELTEATISWQFEQERFASLSDERGCILRVRNLRRRDRA